MGLHAHAGAVALVSRVALGIRDLQQVRRNGPAIVVREAPADIVAGRAEFGAIEALGVFQQFLHPLGVGREHAAHIGFWKIGFCEPPDSIHGVLCTDFALVHPLDRRREFGGVVPEEFFGEPKVVLVAEAEHDAKVVEGTHRASTLVRATEIKHEAPGGLEHAFDGVGELEQPVHVGTLGCVAVFFLALECEWR